MKPKIRSLLWAGVLALPVCGYLWAVEPAKPATTGRVLVLDNDRIMEGEVSREGARYRIQRALGETWIGADKVVRLCASREEAFYYLRSRVNLRDADERLRLARWCHLHGLRELGAAEAMAVLEIRPQSAEARRLMQGFQRAAQAKAQPAADKNLTAAAPVAINMDLTLEAVGLFATKVQPILMNTCANCHASERGGAFRLQRTFDEAGGNQRTTQQNLAAVLAQINTDNWQASPLLIKSVSVHGDINKAPLKSKQTPAYHMLEEWVQMAIANVPPREVTTVANTGRVFAETAPAKPEIVPAVLKTDAKDAEFASQKEPAKKPPAVPATEAAKPATTPPADPFDPAIFNQQGKR